MTKFSLPLACGIIFGSLLLTAALFIVSFQYYRHLMNLKKTDHQYHVTAVIQTGPEKEPLDTGYLIELMELSTDKPVNLYAVNARILEAKLKESPLIKTATLTKEFPRTLYVDYEARRPVAYLMDTTNTLLSHDGLRLPFKPFFSPKNFPQVYLGPLKDNPFVQESLVFLEEFFEKRGLKVRMIDFSGGNRTNKELSELVVLIEGRSGKEILIRLGSYSYKEALLLFDPIVLKEKKRHFIIDLRTRGIALVR